MNTVDKNLKSVIFSILGLSIFTFLMVLFQTFKPSFESNKSKVPVSKPSDDLQEEEEEEEV